MSNYTRDNLIIVDKAQLKPGMLAWSDGHNIFVFPNTNKPAEPSYSMYFYKCASVNSTAKTWNGYMAILSNGVYSFAETLTENLSYGAGFTPSVGKIYNDDATVSISGLWSGLPSDGLVFYATLSANASAAETGQLLSTHSGEVTYTTANGIPCAFFDGSSVLAAGTGNLPYSDSPFTLSFFMCPTSSPSVDTGVFAFGKDSNGCLISVVYSSGVITLATHGGGWGQGTPTQINWDNTMKHIAFVVGQGDIDNRPLSVYLNGVKVTDTYLTMSGLSSDFKMYIGSYWGNADYIPNFTGYLSSLRIYDRALAPDEISTLASEFTTSGGGAETDTSLVFHATLATNATTAETGQALTFDGDVEFTPVDGVPCAFFSGESQITASTEGMPQGNEPMTVCAWVKAAEEVDGLKAVFGLGRREPNQLFTFALQSEGAVSLGRYDDDSWAEGYLDNQQSWNHICITHDGTHDRIYLNGRLDTTIEHENNVGDWKIFIGANGDLGECLRGYVADARIYNRALTQAEITTLYEDKPLSEDGGDNTPSNVPEGAVFYDALSEAGAWAFENEASIVDDTNRKVFNVEYGESYAVLRNNPGNLPLDSSARSMSHWFKSKGENLDSWCGIGYGTSGSNNRYTWGIYGGMSAFTFWAQDIWESMPPEEWENYGIDNGEWHHVVTTFDGVETVKQYIDGELVWSWYVWDVHTSFECIHVGDPWEWYAARGRYADLYIYNRVLSQDEITQLYEARTV